MTGCYTDQSNKALFDMERCENNTYNFNDIFFDSYLDSGFKPLTLA